MREIKFRAWNSILKKMVKVTRIRFWDETVIFFKDKTIGGQVKESALGINNCLLMQYTGLKDKDDKEIYEGDYIHQAVVEKWGSYNIPDDLIGREKQRDEFDGVVEFKDGVFGVEGDDFDFIPIIKDAQELEIIGNIYSNPELLK